MSLKVFSTTNVFKKTKERIHWIYEEFKGNTIVAFSGGKDSTSVLEITLEVVRELKAEGKLPQEHKTKVMWLDQESEWTETRRYVERVCEREEIEMYWMQIPFDLGTNTSLDEDTKLACFDPEWSGEYIQPISELAYDKLYIGDDNLPLPISEVNKLRKIVDGKWVHTAEFKAMEYKGDSFYKIFDYVYSWITGGKSYAIIQGIKASESPVRALQVTYSQGYKGITWSNSAGLNKESVKFSPIYDWSRTDNFVHFAKTECDYNKMYDLFLQYGINPPSMRVSSLIHETAVAHSLPILQEIDRDMYNRMVERLPGVSTYSQMQDEVQNVVLPSNFTDLEEYGKYLIDKIIPEKLQPIFYSMYETSFYKEVQDDKDFKDKLDRVIVVSVLTKDIEKTKYTNTVGAIQMDVKYHENPKYNKAKEEATINE